MSNDAQLTGAVHSIETLGALDGPGLRTVIFLQGCPLRCSFCHNIDCAIREGNATQYTVEDLMKKVLKNKPYWENHKSVDRTSEKPDGDPISGGVTISGGEPTYQYEFLRELLKELKSNNIHTAVDSCSVTAQEILKELAPYVDLWMLSVKHMDATAHINLTGASNKIILENILFLDQILSESKNNAQIRIRFLVIPGITDDPEHIEQLGRFVSKIQNLEYLEILPYGSHGKHKWKELFGSYKLEHIRDATNADLEHTASLLSSWNLPIKV